MLSAEPTSAPDDGPAALAAAERALADAVDLKRWWGRTDGGRRCARRFELIRSFNRSETSFGFFDQAPMGRRVMPVMGVAERMLYDRPKRSPPREVRDELREFVLHYFLRVSAFEQPEASAGGTPGPPRFLPWLSWCPAGAGARGGFGYSQHYYKLRATGAVGAFPPADQARIIDLREVGRTYTWVLAKVRIYDFHLTIPADSPDAPRLVLPLRGESYLVLSPEFLTDEDDPEPGVLGRYGVGYAFVRVPQPGAPLAYGPGEFDASFQTITFRVLAGGETEVDLVFVVNRPRQVFNVSANPLRWGLRLADLLSLGLAAPLSAPLRRLLDAAPFPFPGFDPVTASIRLANWLTGGAAARDYCVSTEQLEKTFLVQHYMQHYQMISGSLLTWRRQSDWRDRAGLPPEVIRGEST